MVTVLSPVRDIEGLDDGATGPRGHAEADFSTLTNVSNYFALRKYYTFSKF